MALTEPFIAEWVETDAFPWSAIFNRQAMLSRDLKYALHKLIFCHRSLPADFVSDLGSVAQFYE